MALALLINIGMKTNNHTNQEEQMSTITVECRRRKTCGYCTDLSTFSKTNPRKCPDCGGVLVVSGTNIDYLVYLESDEFKNEFSNCY